MELYKGKGAPGLTADKLKGAGIGWTDIFEEIPVSVQNSNLVCALMAQVGKNTNHRVKIRNAMNSKMGK